MSFQNQIHLTTVDLFPIQVDGGVSPQMALGSMPTRPALLLRIVDQDGCYGWGEIWANFPPRAHTHKSHLIEDVIAPRLQGMAFVEPREIITKLRECLSVYFLHVGQQEVFEHILAGFDIALWDLALRKAQTSFADFMHLTSRSAQTYASSINTSDIDRLIPHHASLGQLHYKVKVGFLSDADRELVEQAASLLAAGARMMVDSNQMWDLQRAIESLNWLEEFDPLFAEEPIPANADLTDWETLANATSIPLAGGENIYGIENFLRMADVGMTVLQPDVAKWGGVTGALDLANALPSGVELWPHFMGSAVGQMAALSVTAAIKGSSVCEMDVNKNKLRTDLCGDSLNIKNGRVSLYNGNGLVQTPAAHCLENWLIQ